MFDELKQSVYEANMMLPQYGLVMLTWGNVSGIDRKHGVMVIKPSGVEYGAMSPEQMVPVDAETGVVLEGVYKPSSDTAAHLELYRSFPEICGVVHTHSRWATVFAQLSREIPVFGTTHADYFYGAIACTRAMTSEEINGDYEENTGHLIVETVGAYKANPAVLVAGHGPFAWGSSPADAVTNAVVLEEIAFMAWHCISQNPNLGPISQALMDRHYSRKHGPHAYYGQRSL